MLLELLAPPVNVTGQGGQPLHALSEANQQPGSVEVLFGQDSDIWGYCPNNGESNGKENGK